MPVAIKRHVIEIEDMDGHLYNVPYYTVFVFRKEIIVLLFYLSNGFDFAMDYLNVSDVIEFIEEMPKEKDPNYIYFGLSSKCFMKVDRELFKEHQYIQSIVGAFKEITTSRVSIAQLHDKTNWIKRISNPQNYEKGYSILKYVGRLLDLTTQKVLILPDYYNQNIYSIMKWVMEHFNELRLKDNCDLCNKRLRANEYIASLFTKELSKRLNRIISLGDKANIANIHELVK